MTNTPKQIVYLPGFYIEIWKLWETAEHHGRFNGLHSEIVFYKPDGTVEIIRGWQSKFFGIDGGNMTVRFEKPSRKPTPDNPNVPQGTMIIPVIWTGNHSVQRCFEVL